MFQNFSSDDKSMWDDMSIDEVETGNDREFIDKGFEPLGCLVEDGYYIMTDYYGEFSSTDNIPNHDGLYLIGNSLSYFNGDWWIKPIKIIYG